MKKTILTILAICGMAFTVQAANYRSLTWAQVCSGNMGDAWYATAEAQSVADTVLMVQKNNGGWMKNDQLHKLTASEFTALRNARGEHSCLDNFATTQEMRFLARVYQGCKQEKYREAFVKALNMILAAEFKNGGWGQYWPLTDDRWSYQNYITFNDDLETNVLKMMRDVYQNKGYFANLTDEATRQKCIESFDRGIEMIIRCQVDDNGTKAAWCAQHDPVDLLPTEGRPHELPSISGYESASLLSFLMTIEKPSKELQECITSAVQWLDAHKIEGKAIEDYTNAQGLPDRRIVDREGSAIWGRFIQIGGESGEKIYNKLFKKLQDRGKSRSYTTGGKTYTYTEYEIAKASYDPEKAYQPIFAIYKNELSHLFYRFLYNYEDSDPIVDSKGCPIATSLMQINRVSYQYLGSWCQNLIKNEYPAWKQRIDAMNAAGDAQLYILDATTYSSESSKDGAIVYNFNNGFTITNTGGKSYGTGKNNRIKYSANVGYNITIPADMMITKVTIAGYDNYDTDAYIYQFNGETFQSTDYVFPAKKPDMIEVSHTFDLSDNPTTNKIQFKLGAKQCCLAFMVYGVSTTGINTWYASEDKHQVHKRLENGRLLIQKARQQYDLLGRTISH